MKPILYDVVDYLYHSVMDHTPQWLQDKSETSAALLGMFGSFSVVKGVQYLSNIYMSENFNKKYLPILEIAGITSLPIVAFTCLSMDPQAFQEVMQQHPTYSAGMTGSGIGAILGAAQDLRNKRRARLENKV